MKKIFKGFLKKIQSREQKIKLLKKTIEKHRELTEQILKDSKFFSKEVTLLCEYLKSPDSINQIDMFIDFIKTDSTNVLRKTQYYFKLKSEIANLIKDLTGFNVYDCNLEISNDIITIKREDQSDIVINIDKLWKAL